MTAIWTYPWNLHAEGAEESLADLASRGIDAITLPSHYHSVQTMQPRTPENLFQQFPGGCYVEPSPDRFEDTSIDPPVNRVGGSDDPFGDIAETAHEHGLDVNAWLVCLHNSRLGAQNPGYRIQSAFGDAHDHSLCPSHRAVREYFAGVVAETVARGIEEIQLESIGFPTVLHGHGADFGHPKRQVLTSDAETWLLSQCFCDACRRRGEELDVDVDRAQETVQDLLRQSFATPHSEPPALAALAREYPILGELFEFRAEVVDAFVNRLTDAAGRTPVSTYVGEPGANWPSGVRLRRLDSSLDRMLSVCYVADPGAARDRIRGLRRTVSVPVDAGVDMDPERVGHSGQLRALVDAVTDEIDGRLSIYHHGLLTETQLDWVADAI